MQSIKAILRQKWFWICQNKPFWASAFLTLITVAFVTVKPAMVNNSPTDLPVRFWGMCLQLIGAYTVWMDMTKTARDFGEPPSFRKTWEWFKGLFRAPAPITSSVSADLQGVSLVAIGSVTTVPNPSWPIEKRVERLEKEVAAIHKGMTTVRRDLAVQKVDLTANITRHAAELRQEIGTVQNQLKDALVGNYAVLHFGAIWLVVGILMSSVAVEITTFVHLRQLPAFW